MVEWHSSECQKSSLLTRSATLSTTRWLSFVSKVCWCRITPRVLLRFNWFPLLFLLFTRHQQPINSQRCENTLMFIFVLIHLCYLKVLPSLFLRFTSFFSHFLLRADIYIKNNIFTRAISRYTNASSDSSQWWFPFSPVLCSSDITQWTFKHSLTKNTTRSAVGGILIKKLFVASLALLFHFTWFRFFFLFPLFRLLYSSLSFLFFFFPHRDSLDRSVLSRDAREESHGARVWINHQTISLSCENTFFSSPTSGVHFFLEFAFHTQLWHNTM